jgi:hypothetical protein|tara:strand:+ start:1852 stop:2448 length:597 start_codon:yes stop_codon:yes gene_type:complete
MKNSKYIQDVLNYFVENSTMPIGNDDLKRYLIQVNYKHSRPQQVKKEEKHLNDQFGNIKRIAAKKLGSFKGFGKVGILHKYARTPQGDINPNKIKFLKADTGLIEDENLRQEMAVAHNIRASWHIESNNHKCKDLGQPQFNIVNSTLKIGENKNDYINTYIKENVIDKKMPLRTAGIAVGLSHETVRRIAKTLTQNPV